MKRQTMVVGGLALLVAVLLSGCTNNLFSSFDEADPGPSADDLRNAYNNTSDPVARLELAAEAGTARIEGNDDALQTVNNFGNVIQTLSDTSTTPDANTIVGSLFPSGLSTTEAQALVATFKEAGTDFSAMAQASGSVTDDNDPLNSGEKGDAVQMAIISLAVKEIIDADSGNEAQLVELITGQRAAEDLNFGATNPFENLGSGGSDLDKVINYAGLDTTF